MDYKIDILDEFKKYPRAKDILSPDWEKVDDFYINMSLIKSHVKDWIELINNRDNKKWMKSLCDVKKFPFTYKNITNNNPNPGHNTEEFWQNRFVTVEFNIYSTNF